MDLGTLVNKSVDCLDAGKPLEAKKLCLKAIELSPECAEAWSNLSFAELQLQNPKVALKAAEKAISIKPLQATAWHNLGESYLRLHMPEKSLHCNNRALTLDQALPEIWEGKGNALVLLKRYIEAVACFDKALTLNPNRVTARINREVALLLSDPHKKKLLMTAVGISIKLSQGELEPLALHSTLSRLICSDSAFDKDLVRSFDFFAQLNIREKKPTIVTFCLVNKVLATILKDKDLVKLCSDRCMEAENIMENR